MTEEDRATTDEARATTGQGHATTGEAAATPARSALPAWPCAVFVLALLARLGFLWVADQPLLYAHQYTYFTAALRIADHDSPLAWILKSDEWRTWDGHWTIAPLYFVFAGFVFRVFGAHLLPLQLLQCLFDSLAAVFVAILGARIAGTRGHWAGIAYALYFPAIELTSWTMTENLHTPLLTGSVVLLAREAAQPSARRRFLGGCVLGVSALARAVSSGFVFLAACWRLWRAATLDNAGALSSFLERFRTGVRRGWRPAALIAAGGAAAILPWTARNVFIVGDAVLIESAAFENIWWANNFADRKRYLEQEKVVHSQETPAAKRAAAFAFAVEGIRSDPSRVVEKVRTSFWHFLRPEGQQNFVRIERSLEPWRHTLTLLLDDLPLLLCVPLFVVFLFAGRSSPERDLIVLWTAYYLLMVVIIFHNEIRYRSALVPFAFAGAAGGVSVLYDPALRLRVRTLLSAAVGLLLVFRMTQPYVGLAIDAAQAAWALRPMPAAVAEGNLARAESAVAAATAADPRSPRPWIRYGSALAHAGRIDEAIDAYRRAADKASIANWSPRIALPMLLSAHGPSKEALRRLNTLDRLSWDSDPWLILEIAWRELPAPRADEIFLARGDYGAVRGFLHPRGTDPALSAHRLEWNKYERLGTELPPPGGHRWSRHRAWLRVFPTESAASYEVSIDMGAPFPSTLRSPLVSVRADGSDPVRFTLGAEVRTYTFRAPAPAAGEPLLIQLDAPTWCRAGEPAEQGVRVDRLSVARAAE
jgi:hypothetical protein